MALRSIPAVLSDLRRRVALLERRLVRVLGSKDSTPAGVVLPFAGSDAPVGYLLARGGTVLIADYPNLYAVLGTLYGGNGTTTFGLPDMRGRTPVGLNPGDSDFGTLNQAVGAKTHTLTTAQMPSHGHRVMQGWNNGVAGQDTLGYVTTNQGARGYQTNTGGATSPTVEATGGGGAHNNIQPSRALNFIIKT